MSIKRYVAEAEPDRGFGPIGFLKEAEDGEAVLFADHVSSIAAKDAEIAALRQRCGRLRELFDATIDCQSDESTDKDWLRRDIAYAKCIKHNDLDEKEPTDG